MKIASIVEALSQPAAEGLEYSLVHTGQHYDKALSEVFFEQLGLPEPQTNFGIGSGTHAQQTAAIIAAFDLHLSANSTDCVVVVGDVNSTLACALVATKSGIPVAHVEAGLESGDRSMPEEINRLATDAIADYLFCTSASAVENLLRRGRRKKEVFFVGNTMIDTLIRHIDLSHPPECWESLKLQPRQFALCTLHRPSNVDDSLHLGAMLTAIADAADVPVVFPVHPRTMAKVSPSARDLPGLLFEPPMSYLEFLHLMRFAQFVITDSGGIQEETTYLKVPCLTLRENTERPETVEVGTNELVGTRPEQITAAVRKVQEGLWKRGSIPHLWDGRAGTRIAEQLNRLLAPH